METGRVFTKENGEMLHPANVTRRFIELYEEIDLPPVRLHDLRHGAATLAHAAGADLKDIQEMLGHSSITITADTYTSLLPEADLAIAEAAARLVPRVRAASEDTQPEADTDPVRGRHRDGRRYSAGAPWAFAVPPSSPASIYTPLSQGMGPGEVGKRCRQAARCRGCGGRPLQISGQGDALYGGPSAPQASLLCCSFTGGTYVEAVTSRAGWGGGRRSHLTECWSSGTPRGRFNAG
ncbi:tyrosine-type recombinase/integrase [Streptomyces avermitilis]|uniref:tyrosine-type recombinase/integrase n=1 Tax=Streptomyces avermitilis TaxID=33903 RepID=UPI0038020470